MIQLNCFYSFLLLIALCSCSKHVVNPNNTQYKGGKMHHQPSIGVFPEENIYNQFPLVDDVLKRKLDRNISNLISQQGITGLTATVLIPDKGIWRLDTGFVSKNNNVLVDSSTVFYWASVSKLITSTVIHLLMKEHKLELTDKLSKWYPQFENSERITITHLLNHTSGLYSFNSDSAFHYNNEFHYPPDLLAIALSKNDLFEPGTYWSYTNTGYLLLALIAEHIESKSLAEIVYEKITSPQNLSSLKVLEPKELPQNLALAHKNGEVINTNYSMPLGAGNIVSSSKDMAFFFSALLTGKYVSIQTVHKMLDELFPMFDNGQYYGKGMMLYDFKEINNTKSVWIGHSGGTENYRAILIYDFETRAICAISVNQNIAVEAIANRIIALIDEK